MKRGKEYAQGLTVVFKKFPDKVLPLSSVAVNVPQIEVELLEEILSEPLALVY